MAVLEASDIQDLIESTRKAEGTFGTTQFTQSLVEYPTVEYYLRREKAQRTGRSIKHEIIAKKGNAAHMTGLYAEDTYNVANLLDSIDAPWRHVTTNWAFDLREEAMNEGNTEQIVNLIMSRRFDARLGMLELKEDQLWSKPADSTNKDDIWGFPQWVVKNATVGFTGGNPAGFSGGAGGLDTATYANWKNYSGQ